MNVLFTCGGTAGHINPAVALARMFREREGAQILFVGADGGMETRLVNIEKDLCVIPNVAIHMNREMNKGVEYNPQTDMLPLYGECGSGKKNSPLLRRVAKAVGAKQEDILGHDLFLYVRDRGRIFGEGG